MGKKDEGNKGATVVARVLTDSQIDGIAYSCNDVVTFDADTASLAEAAGVIDGTPEAVEAAKTVFAARELVHADEKAKLAQAAEA